MKEYKNGLTQDMVDNDMDCSRIGPVEFGMNKYAVEWYQHTYPHLAGLTKSQLEALTICEETRDAALSKSVREEDFQVLNLPCDGVVVAKGFYVKQLLCIGDKKYIAVVGMPTF